MFNQNLFSLSDFLNGVSNILTTSQKIIPLYSEVKPIFSKIIDLKDKIIKSTNNVFGKQTIVSDIIVKKEELNISSSPQFFI